jgi:RNA polymerase sigma-70 factor (ECF subfamily)
MDALSDDELVEKYRAARSSPRGQAFLNQLFERHHAKVASWCLRMTGDVNSASDMAQDIFLKAFQRIDSFRGDSRFTTWLYSIARNRCLDEMRSRAGKPGESPEAGMEDMPDLRTEQVSSALERRESEQLARQLMRESLDPIEAEVMTMHYVHELPLDAITKLLGLTNASGAKAHIVSARRKLNRAVAAWKTQQPKGGGHVR